MQVKGVPEDVHRVLRARAAAAGKSLQEYLLARLIEDAHTPTLEELFDTIERRHGGAKFSLQAAADAVRADRDAR